MEQQGVEMRPSAFKQHASKSVVLNLYKHAEPLRSFPRVCRTPFLPNITEVRMGYCKGDHG